MRPETMRIVEDLRNQNILTLEHARNNNQKVVGMYCAYSPQELVLAAGALPVSLCGTKQEVISLPAQGVGKERIIAGIHRSVASRIAAMAERPGTGRLIAFPGGVSKNGGGAGVSLQGTGQGNCCCPRGSPCQGTWCGDPGAG